MSHAAERTAYALHLPKQEGVPIMSLRVVGAGLPRTGTSSLKDALEELLGGPCLHMSTIPGHPFDLGTVRTTIPPYRLLEWRADEGWSPICQALGMPLPDRPFPWT